MAKLLFKVSFLILNVVFITRNLLPVDAERILAIEPKGGKSQWNFMRGILRALTDHVKSERILAIEPIAGRSHWNFMKGVLRALTDHGHHVTVFTPFAEGSRENYTEIDLSKDIFPIELPDIFTERNTLSDIAALIELVHILSRDTCKIIYENEAIKNIMTDLHSNFDIIFIELMASECISYLSTRVQLPLVYVSPPPIISYVERSVFGHYPNPAVVSHLLADHSVPRSFFERFTNTLLLVYTTLLLEYKFWIASKVDTQPFDLVKPIKPSLVFSNAHYITDASRPLPPGVIQVGGIHLDPPKKIPEDILEFMDDSPHGVIYFTLGSIAKISLLPENTKKTIIEVLGQVPQKVLLKYEDEMTFDLPKNVMTKKWFPQRDILMHPNVKLFISHGGISGLYEAVDAGVPVLGFPVFFDQNRNLENLVDAGMAIVLSLKSMSKDVFKKSILELTNNEKYMKNAKIVSDQFKDRPMSPAKTVDYWTRYVIRHKGAPYLKSHALNLTWYEYFLLDVIGIALLIIFSILYIAYKLLNFVMSYIFKSSSILKSKHE